MSLGQFFNRRDPDPLQSFFSATSNAPKISELERIEGREEAAERLDDVLFHKIPYISDYI